MYTYIYIYIYICIYEYIYIERERERERRGGRIVRNISGFPDPATVARSGAEPLKP